MLTPLALALLVASPALDQAKAALHEGKLDAVAQALESPNAIPPGEVPEATALLTSAAEQAIAKKDKPGAVYLAQTALKLDPKQDRALQLLAEWSRDDHEWDTALKYARRRAAQQPGNAQVEAWLANLEEQERSFDPGAGAGPRRANGHATSADGTRSGGHRAGAHGSAKALPKQTQRVKITVYGAMNCGLCMSARNWMEAKGLVFDDLDIEKDPAAAKALLEKEKKKGQAHTILPVIEVGDHLLAAGLSKGA
ncbi:MAG: hypothetical protein JST92_06720, partial [Deltaproteobacteria bacterium]|nr:hypothetical protein [Deltaproteobacteria bacterium]